MAETAFSIKVIGDSPCTGRLTIGEFTETFDLNCSRWTTEDYRLSWTQALRELLVDPGGRVVLMTWCCPPPEVGVQRAWVLFHEGESVFVQERIFVPGEHVSPIAPTGELMDPGPRVPCNDLGEPVSEWVTSVKAIDAFLQKESRS